MVLAERKELRRVGGEVGGAVEAVEGTKVQVVIIRPGLSENGLEYRPDVLRDSVRLWEGASAFLDHPTAIDMSRAGGRSVRDLAGYYSSVSYEEGAGVKATLEAVGWDSGRRLGNRPGQTGNRDKRRWRSRPERRDIGRHDRAKEAARPDDKWKNYVGGSGSHEGKQCGHSGESKCGRVLRPCVGG